MKRFVAIALILFGCSERRSQPQSQPAPTRPPAPAATKHDDEPEAHAALPTKVRLPPDVAKAAGIKTVPAATDILPVTVELTGEIATDPDRSARIAARVAGRVIDVHAKEGDRVKAGQVIAVVESPELARARSVLTSAVARARSAQLNAQRLKSLEAKALAAGQEVATAQAEAEALDAEVVAARQTLAAFGPDASQAQGAVARLTLRSPLAGFVLSRDAIRGQNVDAEHVMAVIGDLDRAYFLGRLFEKDLARVHVGAKTEVRLNAYPQDVFEGSVETIGRQLDPAARTVIARVTVRNHGDLLKVGLFGTARVVTGKGSEDRRIVVPNGAITRIADKNVVFVQQPDGDFEVHPVTIGRTAAGRAEVLSGLREGEQVVIDGVFTLKSAILKSTFGEEN